MVRGHTLEIAISLPHSGKNRIRGAERKDNFRVKKLLVPG